MKTINTFKIKSIVLMFAFIALLSCSNDDDGSKSQEPANYALITRPINSDGMTFSAYMQIMDSPNVEGTMSNSNAYEISASHLGGVYEFNEAVYVNDYLNTKITKWTLNIENVVQNSGSIQVPELGFQGNIAFHDDNVAYVGGTGSISIFNPTTMVKTGKIDLSSISRVGEVTDFPSVGATIQADGVSEIIINGNYMYAAMYHMFDFNSFTPATSTCDILVIDLNQLDNSSQDNSQAIVNVISDTRGSFTGAWNTGGGVYYMNKDENGDIYVLCHNVFGGARQLMNKPSCVLRINNGATSFDPAYYFDLESASQGNGNPVTNFEYYGDGKFMATVLDPTQLDPSNPFSFNNDPVFRWWSFDLNTKTATQVSNIYTNAGKAAGCYFENGYAYIPYFTSDSNYINKVNLNNFNDNLKAVTTTGFPNIYKLK
ncbi:MAG: DUF4374 domain-containing protein [Flavobacteriaceae bacterium]|nr:DUF4374 domain-containing protein [Flavobacteriaceae bacterium]